MFFIVTFHQIVFYSLCFGRSWLLIHLMLKLIFNARNSTFSYAQVSIHPMLKLIQRISCIPYNTLYQIPQYLSTFLKFLPATAPFAKKIYKITAMPLFCGFTQFCTDRRLVNFHCITKSTAHHFPYPSFQAPPRQTHFH